MTNTQTATAQTVKNGKGLAEVTELEMKEFQELELKAELLKSKYGIGGEHFSTIPTLMDKKDNPELENEFQLSKLPKRVMEKTFKEWEPNGTIQILPLVKGDKTHYLILVKPNKSLKTKIWNLEKADDENFLKYTKMEKAGDITLNSKNYLITNIYSNKNKAFNQAKLLAKYFQLGTNFKELENQKELRENYLNMEIKDGQPYLQEIGKNNHQPTGKDFQTLEEYIGRNQHTKTSINPLELIS